MTSSHGYWSIHLWFITTGACDCEVHFPESFANYLPVILICDKIKKKIKAVLSPIVSLDATRQLYHDFAFQQTDSILVYDDIISSHCHTDLRWGHVLPPSVMSQYLPRVSHFLLSELQSGGIPHLSPLLPCLVSQVSHFCLNNLFELPRGISMFLVKAHFQACWVI